MLEDSYKTDLKEMEMKKGLLILLLDNMKKEGGLEERLNGSIMVPNILILDHSKINFSME